MVTKLELNNCMITLRGQVKRAKVRTISKLTRKIKKFEQGKVKNPENKKLDTKIKKFGEEIEIIKEIHNIDNVKKLFSFNKDIKKVMAHVNATPEERAMCKLLYMNEFLKTAILDAKKKLSLRDDDEEWVKLLFTDGKRKLLKKQRALEKKGKKVANTESPTKKTSEDGSGSPQKAKKKKAKKEQKELSGSEEGVKKAKKERKDSAGSQEEMEPDQEETAESATKPEVPSPKKNKKGKKNQKNEDKSDKVLKMNDKSKKIQKPKGNAKNFPAKKGKDFKKFNGDSKPHPGKPNKFNKPNKPQNGSPAKFKPGAKRPEKGQKNDKKGQDHPSWEAKKKQKPTIAQFQGKKTKLAD
uniref:Serum response factor-binding protein 1 n=1 Tax=Lutzomyia longipalpis TaxID=7200 RepID=A0A1B0CB49_LUTLO